MQILESTDDSKRVSNSICQNPKTEYGPIQYHVQPARTSSYIKADPWAAAAPAVRGRSSRAGRRVIDGCSGGRAMRGQAMSVPDFTMSQDFTTPLRHRGAGECPHLPKRTRPRFIRSHGDDTARFPTMSAHGSLPFRA